MGDTLQFVRYVDRLVHAGARVVLRVQSVLLPLLRHYPGTAQVIGENDRCVLRLHCPLPAAPRVQGSAAEFPLRFLILLRIRESAQWREFLGDGRPTHTDFACNRVGGCGLHGARTARAPRRPCPLLSADAQLYVQKEVPTSDRPRCEKWVLIALTTACTFADRPRDSHLFGEQRRSSGPPAGALGAPVCISCVLRRLAMALNRAASLVSHRAFRQPCGLMDDVGQDAQR